MKVTVLYFAALRDLVRSPQESIDLEGSTIGDLVVQLEREHPALLGKLSRVRVARNQRFANPTDQVETGDEIAFIPPVAGG